MSAARKSLNPQNLKDLDKSNMLGLLMDFSLQLRKAQEIAKSARILFEKRNFNSIVFAGLGGSAIGADLVRSYLYYESKLPISVFREYKLPAYLNSSTLVFLSSYSGNTEETLSAYQEAKDNGSSMICISSGGKLREHARKDNVTFIEIPEGLPPRCALGYLSIIPLCILSKLGLINDVNPAVAGIAAELERLKNKTLSPRIAQKENTAKYIASRLYNKLAIIYSASIHFDVCAVRLRCQLNENSKCLATSHLFPEMNHNEIVGWCSPKKMFKDFAVLMLRDKDMHKRTALRMDITKDILKKEGVEVLEIWSQGESLLARIFSLIYIGDFISYYLAILYGIDPTPVERVTYLKNQLAKSK